MFLNNDEKMNKMTGNVNTVSTPVNGILLGMLVIFIAGITTTSEWCSKKRSLPTLVLMGGT